MDSTSSTYPSSAPPSPPPMDTPESSESLGDSVMMECPVCGKAFIGLNETQIEEHVGDCLKESKSRITGNRYAVSIISSSYGEKECGICYEEFTQGKRYFCFLK